MRFLESRSGPSPEGHDTWFVDLFVRCTNVRAIAMYEGMGYSVYRRVVGYYNGMEGAGDSPDELDGFGECEGERLRDSRGRSCPRPRNRVS